MAKKNASKDGVVYDTHSKVVMSQGGTFEKMKEKITAVRAVVPNKSNNEIALVLQHFENSVDCAVQAFVEGSAVEILKEWSVSGKKKPKKKKKPKAQSKPDPAPDGASVIAVEVPVTGASESVNGFLHANGSAAVDGDSVDSLSEPLESASLEEQEETHAEDTAAQARPRSVCGSQSGEDPGRSVDARRGAPSVDRSLKDLQRCAASLSRYRALIREESNSTVRRIKQSFAELQTSLIDREVTLLADMDKAKAEALSLLDWRQNRAEELKRLADQSEKLSEDQLTQLRADIKHFVSERKFDEELGRAGKFTDELEPLKNSITLFGSVHHPQVNFSSGSRCSSSASSSSIAAPVSAREEPPPQNRVPHKQIFHGNRRIIQGYQGNQRYNGTAQGSRGGFRQMGDRSHTHSSSHTHPSGPRGERGMQNTTTGLPQRPPRTHAH